MSWLLKWLEISKVSSPRNTRIVLKATWRSMVHTEDDHDHLSAECLVVQ